MTMSLPARLKTGTVKAPQVVLAMQDAELRDALFSPVLKQRLIAVANCDFDLVITDFDTVPDHILDAADVVLTGWFSPRIDEAILRRMPRLRLIAHAGGTVKDHVDPVCWTKDITVTTAAIANALPVAEYALAQILLAGKSVLAATHLYRERQGKIDREAEFPHAGNYKKVIGIVGASTIGRLVIDRLKPFDLEALLYDPTVGPVEAAELGVRKVSLDELMRLSDVVSLHAPVLPETVGIVGRNELAAMRVGSTLINTARGDLVDHEALREELQAKRINAVLDVTSPEPLERGDPLFDLPNVQLTPHIAGSMGHELHRMTEFAVSEIENFAAGRSPRYPVRLQDLDRSA